MIWCNKHWIHRQVHPSWDHASCLCCCMWWNGDKLLRYYSIYDKPTSAGFTLCSIVIQFDTENLSAVILDFIENKTHSCCLENLLGMTKSFWKKTILQKLTSLLKKMKFYINLGETNYFVYQPWLWLYPGGCQGHYCLPSMCSYILVDLWIWKFLLLA